MIKAFFVGRFQPFHNAHLIDVFEILKKSDWIIIGIGSSREKNTARNPFSYAERKKMITMSLTAEGIKNFSIFPVPDFYDDKKWIRYIKTNLAPFDAAYSGNKETLRCFRLHKVNAIKLRLREGTSSTKIRKMIAKKQNWKKLVPRHVAQFICEIKGEDRITIAADFDFR